MGNFIRKVFVKICAEVCQSKLNQFLVNFFTFLPKNKISDTTKTWSINGKRWNEYNSFQIRKQQKNTWIGKNTGGETHIYIIIFSGGSRGGAQGPRLPVIFRPNWGPKGEKNVWESGPPSLKVWMTSLPFPPSPSQDLDPALIFALLLKPCDTYTRDTLHRSIYIWCSTLLSI